MSLKFELCLFKLICVLLLIKIPCLKLMSLNGESQSSYLPCGLGFMYLQNLVINNETIWRSVVDFTVYPKLLLEAELDIVYEEPVALVSMSNKAIVTLKNSTNWTLKIADDVPKQFVFDIKLSSTATMPKVKAFSINGEVICDEDKRATQSIENEKENSTIYCGRRSMKHTEFVTMGVKAERGEWPWHVAVFIQKENSKEAIYECGGNILSATAVVTAGHCVFKNGNLTEANRVVIFAGTTDLSQVNDIDTQLRRAKKVALHPSFNEITATADLAVIKIEPLIFNQFVQPICLWQPIIDKTELFNKPTGVVAGFGLTENNTFSNVLRVTNIIVQNDATCIAYSPKMYQNLLNDFTFCAGYGPTVGVTPRNGDSGGGITFPVMEADHKISWHLRGVLSKCGSQLGETICDPQFYVVYTDVGPHHIWLNYHANN